MNSKIKKLFGRQATVSIGKSGQSGLLINGLRVQFNISKTETSEPNTAVITINNLSKDTQNKITVRDELLLELRVGYLEIGTMETIFVGDIVNVSHNNAPSEVSTEITVEDGARAIRNTRLSLSLIKDSTLTQLLQKIIKAFGLPEKTRLGLIGIPDVRFSTGVAFEGYASTLMNQVCRDNGLSWSIQNNEIKIVKNAGDDSTQVTKTVLIGSPRRLIKKADMSSADNKTNFDGWEFDTLLLPPAEPAGKISLSSVAITPAATLTVKEVKHMGDTHGDEWTTTITGALT